MSDKKVGPSEFKAEAERLHAAGKLPSLEELLSAVHGVRQEYAPKILEARKQGEEPEEA
jgi:ribosomal protein L10